MVQYFQICLDLIGSETSSDNTGRKKVKVENYDYYLEQILVNDKPLNYKNLPEFTILCTQNDAITYKNKNKYLRFFLKSKNRYHISHF